MFPNCSIEENKENTIFKNLIHINRVTPYYRYNSVPYIKRYMHQNVRVSFSVLTTSNWDITPAAHHQLLSYVITSVVVRRRSNVTVNFDRVCTRICRILISFRISCTRKRHCQQSYRHNFLV